MRWDLGGLVEWLPAKTGAAVVGGAVAWLGWRYWERGIGHDTLRDKLGAVFVPMALATLVYWSVTLFARVPAAREIIVALWQNVRRKPE